MEQTSATDAADEPSDDDLPAEPEHSSTYVRSTAMVTLAVLGVIVFIDWAQAVLLPLVLAILLSQSLDPLLTPFDKMRIPRPLSAALVLLAVLAGMAAAVVPLQTEALALLEKVPAAIERLQRDGAGQAREQSVMAKAQEVAQQIKEMASEGQDGTPQQRDAVTPVRLVDPPLDIKEWLLTSSSHALMMATQFISVLFLVYFMLAIGNLYQRKIVRMAGPTFARRREMVGIFQDIHLQVRRFLFITVVSAVFVGVLSWGAFVLLGFEQAAFWGTVAGIASAIPYLGPFLVLLGTGAAAFIQFGSIEMAVLIAGVSLLITSIQGYLLLPMMTSRVASINMVATFAGLLFWGWIWGPVGLIIATPLIMIMKSLCDHSEPLQPLGELLGE